MVSLNYNSLGGHLPSLSLTKQRKDDKNILAQERYGSSALRARKLLSEASLS
jgi:hypothetical protein